MNKNDKKIKTLRKRVDELRLALGKEPNFEPKTGGFVDFDNTRLNLTEMEEEQLIAVYATLKADYLNHIESAKVLGYDKFILR